MKKTVLIFLTLISSFNVFSQEQLINPTSKLTQKGFFAIDYLSVDMPRAAEKNMGLTGIHYNLWINKYFYSGIGFYGSVQGERGGLFTLGLNLGFKKHLNENLFLDAGLHLGGGGGDGAPDGGGAMFLPHVNLGYQFKTFSVVTGISAINFFDKGDINSHQLHLGIHIPISSQQASFQSRELTYTADELKSTDWNQKSNRLSVMLHLNNISPYGESKFTNGNTLNGNTIRLAGFEINSYFQNNWFTFLKLDGAYDGIKAGYMDILVGAGYHLSLNNSNTNLLAKFGIGAGGGGGVETEGGFLLYPDLSIEQRLLNNLFISINKGYLLSPNSKFEATTFGIGLKYYVDKDGLLDRNKKHYSQLKFKGVQIALSQLVYFDARRDTNPTENLHQLSLQANLFLNKHLYLAGQTSFANFGNAGAYAEGIVGVGFYSKAFLNYNVNFFAQVLAGAAGGGNISTGEGLIIKPSIGFNYYINNSLSLRTSLGRVKARGGSLNSTSFSFGVNYNLSFLKATK